jgi:hypothetical protein
MRTKFLCITVAVIMVCSTIIGCGDSKVIDGVQYETYGLINADKEKNPNIEYRLIKGNVFWGIVLCETIIAPVYFFGFSLHEPVRKIDKNKPKE